MIAKELSKLSSCRSRNVGCVITDKYDRMIGSGYNGIPSGIEHICQKKGCLRKEHNPGENIKECFAIHAEANALMHCNDIKNIKNIFIWGASPCVDCTKLICNSTVENIYVNELYSQEQVYISNYLLVCKKINLFKVEMIESGGISIERVSN